MAVEALQPGDQVLFFTDGVVDGRSAATEEFGIDRLADGWERYAASHHEPDEVLRQLIDDVMGHSAGKLHDDASLMVLRWRDGSS